MTKLELEKLREVSDNLSPAPWRVYRCSEAGPNEACGIKHGKQDPSRDVYQVGVVVDTSRDECHHAMHLSEAAFIAAARTAVPDLLDENAALRKALKEAIAEARNGYSRGWDGLDQRDAESRLAELRKLVNGGES